MRNESVAYHQIPRFHMNEGHAALLGLELLDEHARWLGRTAFNHDDVDAIRQRCVFTTHTPVPAGHDLAASLCQGVSGSLAPGSELSCRLVADAKAGAGCLSHCIQTAPFRHELDATPIAHSLHPLRIKAKSRDAVERTLDFSLAPPS